MLNITSSTPQNPRKTWLATAALFLAAFMNLLDVSIVNLALPALRENLNATSSQLQWVMAIYVLTFAAGLLPFGRFGDAFGREKMFFWGLVGFLTASLSCGLSDNINMLIVSRALQGIAGAMMVPQVLAIIHAMYPPEQKARIIALLGTVNSLGAVAGPAIGGLVLSLDILGLGWRPIFLLNIPIGILSLIGAARYLPKTLRQNKTSPDWLGALLFGISIVCFTYPLIEGRPLGWPLWCISLIIISLILFGMFVRLQVKLNASQKPQLFPVYLMRNRAFMIGLVILVLFFSGIAGTMFMLAYVLQTGFGFSPLNAGLALAPHPAGVMLASLIAARLGNAWHEVRISLGALLIFIGTSLLSYLVGNSALTVSSTMLIAPLFIIGIGMGTAIIALFQSILAQVPINDAGAGSGVMQAFQHVGIAIGIALIGLLFFYNAEGATDQFDHVAATQIALWYPISVYLALACINAAFAFRKSRANG